MRKSPNGQERRPDGPIENYVEWSRHLYDPGHYLGGTIAPHLRKHALGPLARRRAGWFLIVSGAVTMAASIAWSLMDEEFRWWGILLYALWILLLIAAGSALLASGRSSKRSER